MTMSPLGRVVFNWLVSALCVRQLDRPLAVCDYKRDRRSRVFTGQIADHVWFTGQIADHVWLRDSPQITCVYETGRRSRYRRDRRSRYGTDRRSRVVKGQTADHVTGQTADHV